MQVFHAIILGLVQGVCEFLPVSSSGHVIFAQRLLGVAAQGAQLNAVLHLGTLAAVTAVFYKQIADMLKPPFKKLWLLAWATLPAALAGVFAEGFFDALFGGKYLGVAFLFSAALLFAAHFISKKSKNKKIGFKEATVMGVMQAAALVPGVSRSGSVLAGGIFCGCNAKDCAPFAFIMSLPIVLGACVFSLAKGAPCLSYATAAGFFSSLMFGVISAKFMLRLISKNNFLPFCIYLVVAAAAAFALL